MHPSTQNPPAAARWFRVPNLMARYGVSRQTIYVWRRRGILPPAVKLGPNVIAWSPESIAEFERQRASA